MRGRKKMARTRPLTISVAKVVLDEMEKKKDDLILRYGSISHYVAYIVAKDMGMVI